MAIAIGSNRRFPLVAVCKADATLRRKPRLSSQDDRGKHEYQQDYDWDRMIAGAQVARTHNHSLGARPRNDCPRIWWTSFVSRWPGGNSIKIHIHLDSCRSHRIT